MSEKQNLARECAFLYEVELGALAVEVFAARAEAPMAARDYLERNRYFGSAIKRVHEATGPHEPVVRLLDERDTEYVFQPNGHIPRLVSQMRVFDNPPPSR